MELKQTKRSNVKHVAAVFDVSKCLQAACWLFFMSLMAAALTTWIIVDLQATPTTMSTELQAFVLSTVKNLLPAILSEDRADDHARWDWSGKQKVSQSCGEDHYMAEWIVCLFSTHHYLARFLHAQ